MNKIAFSSSSDYVFVASVTSIRGYLLRRGRNYEHGHLSDAYDEFSCVPVSCQNNCALSALLSGKPDMILVCDVHGDEINSIKCSVTRQSSCGWAEEVLTAVTNDGKVYIWTIDERSVKDALDQKKTIQFEKPLIYNNEVSTWSIAVSTAAEEERETPILAVGANNYQITLIDIKTGKLIRKLIGHHHNIPSLAFSPCGKYLMSGSVDESCIIWDVKAGRIVKRMPLASGQWGWGTAFLETKDIEPAMKDFSGLVNGFKDRRIFTGLEGLDQDSPEMTYQDLLSDSFEDHEDTFDQFAENNVEFGDEFMLGEDLGIQDDWETMRHMMDSAILQQLQSGESSVFVFDPHSATASVHQPLERRRSTSIVSWVSDPPRGHHESITGPESAFIRVLNRHATTFEHPRPPPHAVYDIAFPAGNLLSVCTTQANLVLYDVSTGSSLLTIPRLLKKANPAWPQDWNVSNRERFEFVQWIPEFSCLLVGNQTSNLVLLHFTRVLPTSPEDDSDLLRISVLGFPCIGMENTNLKGVSVRKVQSPGVLLFEIFFADVSGVVRIFKLERIRTIEPCLDLFRL